MALGTILDLSYCFFSNQLPPPTSLFFPLTLSVTHKKKKGNTEKRNGHDVARVVYSCRLRTSNLPELECRTISSYIVLERTM